MAHEIRFAWIEDQTDLYAVAWQEGGGAMQPLRVSDGSLEVWGDGDIDDFDIALTEIGGGLYTGTFPTTGNVGIYTITFYQGDKTVPENVLGMRTQFWDGTNLVDVTSAQPTME